MLNRKLFNTRLILSTGLVALAMAPTMASAQAAQAAPADDHSGLEEIVVTAQKREQSLQDVPVAVTAISKASIEANRIVNVSDLSGIAPNVVVRPAAGGTGIASFTVRGVNSYGVAPGSDKEVSINLDGVYISTARGSIFDLADIERIEMLRGPQGTLFGRNATAGAVSIITRNPTGKFGVTQTFTVGNYDQFRTRTTIDLPQVGPFSAYVSFVHAQRNGDTVNTNAGIVWDKTGPNMLGKQVSPKTLGDHNSEGVFAAVKFEASDNFKATYKFDWSGDHFTPEANAAVIYNPATSDGKVITALMQNQVAGLNTTNPAFPTGYIVQPGTVPVFAPLGKSTGFASNAWTVPGYQRNSGHNLTLELRASDSMTIKDIVAYRSNYMYGASDLAGLGGMVLTPAANAVIQADTTIAAATRTLINANVGNRYLDFGTQRLYKNQQWSNELQLNYNSDLMNLTLGAIYFHSKEREGGPDTLFSSKNRFVGVPDNTGLLPQADGTLRIGANTFQEAIFYNQATSYAGYGQAEVHVMPVLDLVAGFRYTHDDKSGNSVIGGKWNPATPGDRINGTMTYTSTPTSLFGGLLIVPAEQQSFVYSDNQPSYSLGVNYKPNNDLLVYGKYSRSYVSGGKIANLTWKPEIAKSWEAGIKSTLLDGKLRANLAVFSVTYENLQLAQGGSAFALSNPNIANVPVIITGVNVPFKVKGFELELTAAPTRGLTLGANLGLTSAKFDGTLSALVLVTAASPMCGAEFAAFAGSASPSATVLSNLSACETASSPHYHQTLLPKWTSNLFAQYETEALFNGGRLSFRVDASFRSSMRLDANDDAPLPGFEPVEATPATWILNGRVALSDIEVGAVKTTLALWGRNLTNDQSIQFTGGISGVSRAASFTPARTFGADLTVKF
jgi:iron complex outermembrane receptor protein